MLWVWYYSNYLVSFHRSVENGKSFKTQQLCNSSKFSLFSLIPIHSHILIDNVIQEVLIILNSWVANSWIDPIDESIKVSTNHRLRNLYHLIIIYSWSSTNFQQPLSILIISFRVVQVHIISKMKKLNVFP